jgi:hypothetical protein
MKKITIYFESILISALFFTHLTIPTQFLKPFRLKKFGWNLEYLIKLKNRSNVWIKNEKYQGSGKKIKKDKWPRQRKFLWKKETQQEHVILPSFDWQSLWVSRIRACPLFSRDVCFAVCLWTNPFLQRSHILKRYWMEHHFFTIGSFLLVITTFLLLFWWMNFFLKNIFRKDS